MVCSKQPSGFPVVVDIQLQVAHPGIQLSDNGGEVVRKHFADVWDVGTPVVRIVRTDHLEKKKASTNASGE